MLRPQLLPVCAPGSEAEADPEGGGEVSANRFCPLLGEAHGPHEFDYSEDGAHYAGHCDGDQSPYAGGPTLHYFPNDPHEDGPDVCNCGAGFWEGFNIQAVKVAHLRAFGVSV